MLLALDTTTEILHLALIEGDRAWTRRVVPGMGRGHSERLIPTLDALMAEAGAAPADLSGVAACLGPGGFTSLRIGVATAEGLGLTGLPTWGFSAFALRAEALRQAGVPGPLWILLDGQRGEAFHQRWDSEPTEAAAKHPLADLPGRVGAEAWWAPEAFASKVEAALPPDRRIILADEGAATLAGLVALARRVSQGPPEAPLTPFYLRETDAEVNFPAAAAHLPWVICLNHRIVAQGTPDEIFTPEILSETYQGNMLVIKQDGMLFVQQKPHGHTYHDVLPNPVPGELPVLKTGHPGPAPQKKARRETPGNKK